MSGRPPLENGWTGKHGSENVSLGQRLHFSDYNLALQAAIAGQGIILGSKPVLARLVDAGLLIDPFDIKVTTDIGYDLVTTERARRRPEVQSFIRWIATEAGAGATGHV
jgi:LysR family transcriptional regulator, glycine cleavage system transcriptional activator